MLAWKKSLILRSKDLTLFANGLTARDTYCLRKGDNLRQPNQMQLSEKQETFCQFFFAFLKSTLNFEHFPKKKTPPSSFISEITDSEKRT